MLAFRERRLARGTYRITITLVHKRKPRLTVIRRSPTFRVG
jgi:hypothetical protein